MPSIFDTHVGPTIPSISVPERDQPYGELQKAEAKSGTLSNNSDHERDQFDPRWNWRTFTPDAEDFRRDVLCREEQLLLRFFDNGSRQLKLIQTRPATQGTE